MSIENYRIVCPGCGKQGEYQLDTSISKLTHMVICQNDDCGVRFVVEVYKKCLIDRVFILQESAVKQPQSAKAQEGQSK